MLSATLGMMFMAGGIDLITLFIGLETMAVSFYILAGYIRPNRRSNEAALKYFLLGAFSLGDPALRHVDALRADRQHASPNDRDAPWPRAAAGRCCRWR